MFVLKHFGNNYRDGSLCYGKYTLRHYHLNCNELNDVILKKKKKIIDNCYLQKRISFNNYFFVEEVDNSYINISKNNLEFEISSAYPNVSYNFNESYLRDILKEYIRPKDLNICLVAGGFFSSYKSENPISKNFPRLFSKFESLSDIDIYLPSSY